MRVFLKTFGCAQNQADSGAIAAALHRAGHSLVASEECAEAIVVNTCGVKSPTQARVLAYLAKHSARIRVVTGCLPYIALREVCAAAPRASIVGVNPALAAAALRRRIVDLRRGDTGCALSGVVASIGIAQGCLGHCAYCAARLARGRLRSKPLRRIITEVRHALACGAVEVRLCAQDVAAWGSDLGVRLPALLAALCELPGLWRLRLGMMHPASAAALLDELPEAMRHEKVFKFVHLPLQSGSDAVLRAMARGYCADDFVALVHAFRAALPDITLATDVIAGYPGETEEDFEATLALLARLRPDVTNVSKFGPRPGTHAAALRQLDSALIKRRSATLAAAAQAIALEKNAALIGKSYNVLVTEHARGAHAARNASYKAVLLRGARLGEMRHVTIMRATPRALLTW